MTGAGDGGAGWRPPAETLAETLAELPER